jgi:putative acetyltransferase
MANRASPVGRGNMAEADPKFGLRPMLPADGPILADIFRASIEGLTDEDYSPDQQEAWASAADEEATFGERLAGNLTLVATLQQSPVAFASLAGNDTIDMLYVHPAAAGRGVATMLVDALERLAAGRGTTTLTTDASDTAREFFSTRGYTAQRRNTVTQGGEWLSNTTMTKQLSASGGDKQ